MAFGRRPLGPVGSVLVLPTGSRATLAHSAHRRLRASYDRSLRLSAGAAAALHLLFLQSPVTTPEVRPVALRQPPLPSTPLMDIVPIDPVAAPVRPQVFDTGYEVAEIEPPAVSAVQAADPPEWAPALPTTGSATSGERPPLSLGEVSHPPEIIQMVPAAYPELARMAEAEGTVLLAVTVGIDGTVTDAQVVESDALESLERAALAAVRSWIFRPARQGAYPVAVVIHVPVRFSLR